MTPREARSVVGWDTGTEGQQGERLSHMPAHPGDAQEPHCPLLLVTPRATPSGSPSCHLPPGLRVTASGAPQQVSLRSNRLCDIS